MLIFAWTAFKILTGSAAAYCIVETLRRLFFHPLSVFPGPRLAAATDLYTAYYDLVVGGGLVDQLEVLHEIYGPVLRIGPNQLHFNDPRAFDEIYATGSKFTKEPYFYDAFNEPESSFGYIDVRQAKQRKDVMRPLFSRRAILKLEGVIQTTVDELVSMLLTHTAGPSVNLHLGFLATSMEVITSYCFARSYDALAAPGFRHPTLVALESTGTIFAFMQHFPFIAPLIHEMPPWLARALNPAAGAYAALLDDIKSQIATILADPAALEHAEHEIIYHHLLAGGKSAGAGKVPTVRSLLDEARVMVAAGSDTVGNTCSLGTFYVLHNAAVCAQLVRELGDAWTDVDAPVGLERLEKLPYLTAVIKESLRVSHGVVSPLPRVVDIQTDIAGVRVPVNTIVAMGASFMHYDADVFEDPRAFRPERWMDQSTEMARVMERFLVPFSKGPRSCLGVNLAWAELYLIFANVFRKVEMEVDGNTVGDFKFMALLTPRYRGRPLHVKVKGVRST